MATTGTQQPVHRSLAITETENLYPVYLTGTLCPFANTCNSLFFTFTDTSRGNLNTIHTHLFKQGASYHQLLMRHERDTTRLLSIAQSGVHYFYSMILVIIYAHIPLSYPCFPKGNQYRQGHSSDSISYNH